ncbi:DUF4423 domain-containing protein [Bdellovibrio bacteriovorus]|uniref:TIGR02147 family protein n=1 Tax=Bdellovibrio bacteriovorus TaxID=959 RepID=A0A1Z3N8N2_BDEBC|nr:DUF4423 domain-containing protein [Bdellovibrio bacteriovorus]ASD63807.1 TIGR02147 family protein [Bdellovibrio bacteriovorus]
MSNPFGNFLKSKLDEIQKRNPRFSFRSLAKKVAISPGCLNELMHGKRPLSEFYASKIVLGLELGVEERNQVYAMIATRSRKFNVQKRLTEQQLELLSSWEHFAILNLMRIPQFQSSEKWISQRLGIPVEKVQHSLDLLMNLGFIKMHGNIFVRTVASLGTTSDIPSHALVQAHVSDMNKAIEVLKVTTPDRRDYSAITLAFNPEKMTEVKALIKKFRQRLSLLAEEGEPSEVYNLNIQFFPLTVPVK